MKVGKILIIAGAGLIAVGGYLSANGGKDIKSFLRGNKNIKNVGKQILGDEKTEDILNSGVIDQVSDLVSKDALPLLNSLKGAATKAVDTYSTKGAVIKGYSKIDAEIIKNHTKKLKGKTVYIDTKIDGKIKKIKVTKGGLKKLEDGVTKVAFISDNQITIFKKPDLLKLIGSGKTVSFKPVQLEETIKGHPYVVPSYAYNLSVDDKDVSPSFKGDMHMLLGDEAENLKVGIYKDDGLKNIKPKIENGKVIIKDVSEKQYPYIYNK